MIVDPVIKGVNWPLPITESTNKLQRTALPGLIITEVVDRGFTLHCSVREMKGPKASNSVGVCKLLIPINLEGYTTPTRIGDFVTGGL